MKMKDRKNSGFTLVELVVVMVIVGILAVVSVPMYTQYVDRARAQEGVALVGGVASAQQIYYYEHSSFVDVSSLTTKNSKLGVDGSPNTYFTQYTVDVADNDFTVVATGSGKLDDWTAVAQGGAGSETLIGLFDEGGDQVSGDDSVTIPTEGE